MLHETKQHVSGQYNDRPCLGKLGTVMLMSADGSAAADAVFKIVADIDKLAETCYAGQWHCSVLSRSLSCTATSVDLVEGGLCEHHFFYFVSIMAQECSMQCLQL